MLFRFTCNLERKERRLSLQNMKWQQHFTALTVVTGTETDFDAVISVV